MIRLAVFLTWIGAPVLGQGGAHDPNDPAHWYDRECCSLEDCAPVPMDVIRATDEGWLVRIGPGDHPTAFKEQTRLIPFGHRRVRVSQDGDFHACLGVRTNTIYCIYIPPIGF